MGYSSGRNEGGVKLGQRYHPLATPEGQGKRADVSKSTFWMAHPETENKELWSLKYLLQIAHFMIHLGCHETATQD